MNTTTSSAMVVRMKGSARSGASAATSSTVPTPSSSAAAARKARLKSSSVRSDGRAPMDGYKVQKTSGGRSEEHTSELQSQSNIVCRLLLEKKKKIIQYKLTQSQRVDNQ